MTLNKQRKTQPFDPISSSWLLWTLSVFFSYSITAGASDLRLGVSLGYGGAGVSGTSIIDTISVPVTRSEGPGTFSLSADTLLSDDFSLGFEHLRGLRLGPFSSQVTFTGLEGRWHFQTPAPSVSRASLDKSLILVRRFSPFIGFGLGIASADVTRSEDAVPEVTGSGLYFGYRMGAEYPLKPGLGLRPEVIFMTTLMSPNTVNLFSIQCGFYFYP